MSKDSYSQSPWENLGHPAFENDYLINLEEIEWWDTQDLESDDIINS